MELVRISDSVKFAKEVADDLAGHDLPTESDVQAAVDIMNHHLFGMHHNQRMLLQAGEAYLIQDDAIDLELISEEQIQQSRIENTLMRAKIDSFHWIGSVALQGFGLRVFGVDFVSPKLHHTATAFIPLDSMGPQINYR